jgi:hypothetical protein
MPILFGDFSVLVFMLLLLGSGTSAVVAFDNLNASLLVSKALLLRRDALPCLWIKRKKYD